MKKNKEKPKGDTKKYSKKTLERLKILKEYCDKIREAGDKKVVSIWVLNPDKIPLGKEITVAILINNSKDKKLDVNKISKSINKIEKEIMDKHNLKILTVHYLLSDFYSKFMKGDIDLFVEIKDSVIIYDEGFAGPIRNLIVEGKVSGTAESMTRRLLDMKKRIKKVHSLKIDMLEKLYFSVVSLGQATIIAGGYNIPIHKDVASELEKKYGKSKLIGRQHIELCEEIVNLFKEFERGNNPRFDGKKLDSLFKGVNDYIYRLGNLIESLEDGR